MIRKISFVLAVWLLTPMTVLAVPVCVAYDANGNCTLWLDTNSGQTQPPSGTGGGVPGQCVCTMYDENLNCLQAVCN